VPFALHLDHWYVVLRCRLDVALCFPLVAACAFYSSLPLFHLLRSITLSSLTFPYRVLYVRPCLLCSQCLCAPGFARLSLCGGSAKLLSTPSLPFKPFCLSPVVQVAQGGSLAFDTIFLPFFPSQSHPFFLSNFPCGHDRSVTDDETCRLLFWPLNFPFWGTKKVV